MTAISSFLHNHPKQIIILMAVLAAIGGFGASKSQVDNSLAVWQSQDDPNWLAYQDFLVKSQLTDPLIIFIPTELDSFVIEDISDTLSDLDTVRSCRDMGFTTTAGKAATLFTVTPVTDADPQQLAALLEQIQSILTEQDISFYLGGVWYLTHELDTLSAQSTTILFPVVIAVTALIVFLICRAQAILILACGLIPSLLLVGIMGFFSVKMNMVLLALPPLTLILGLAHGIHFAIKDWGEDDSAVSVFKRVALPCTISGLTTSLGFASLLLSSYTPVQELGLWGSVGCLLSLAITFILVPAFLRPGTQARFRLPAHFSEQLARRKTLIFATLVFILIFAGIGLSRLQTGSLILDFFADDSEVRSNYSSIEESGIGLTPMEINLYGRSLSRSTVDKPLRQLSVLHPEITHFIFSMSDYSTQVMNIGAAFRVPPVSTPDLAIDRITILMQTISSEATLALAVDIESFLQQHIGNSDTPYITGSVPLYTHGQQELFNSMLRSFSVAFLTISLLIGLMLRSVKQAFVAMVPNILPVILVLSIMGWFGIPLSVATMTVASIIFGIVVDDTIHFLYTFQNSPLKKHERLNSVFQQVGRPIITTTIVTGTGFLAFLASPFTPLAHFGLLISLALWMALLCDLCLLPLLLLEKNHG